MALPMRRLPSLLVALAAVVAATPTRAQGPAPATPIPAASQQPRRLTMRLVLTRKPGAEACAPTEELREALSSGLRTRRGYDPFAPNSTGTPAGVLTVEIARTPAAEGRRFGATYTYVDEAGAPVWKEPATYVYPGSDTGSAACFRVIEFVAAEFALELIPPPRPLPPPPPQPLLAPPPPPPPACPTPPVEPILRRCRRSPYRAGRTADRAGAGPLRAAFRRGRVGRLRGRVGGARRGDRGGRVPAAGVGMGRVVADGGAPVGSPADRDRTAHAGCLNVDVSSSLVAGSLAGCVYRAWPVSLAGCVVGELGEVQQSAGTPDTSNCHQTALFAGGGVGARIVAPLFARLYVQMATDVIGVGTLAGSTNKAANVNARSIGGAAGGLGAGLGVSF